VLGLPLTPLGAARIQQLLKRDLTLGLESLGRRQRHIQWHPGVDAALDELRRPHAATLYVGGMS
jgi:hypothetical protein